nr:flippase-like domain-containing protein [Lachnospiraceae bacterium]
MAVLLTGTLYALLKDQDLPMILAELRGADKLQAVAALLMAVCYLLLQSVSLVVILRSLGMEIRLLPSLRYSFIGFLFNAITPSASGGQPMQVLYMNMDGINMGASSVALLFWTILYKLVLLVIEGVFLLWKQDFLLQALGRYQWLYWIGILVNAVSIILYGLIVFSKNGAKKIVRMAAWLLYRLHIVKRRERLLCKLDVLLDAYQEGAVYMRTHLDTAVIVFGITLLQRLSYFLVTWFVLCSLGVQAGSMGDILILQSLVSVCIDILPFPGGVGVNESFFVTIFRPFVGQSRAFSTMLLSRGVSFYALLHI